MEKLKILPPPCIRCTRVRNPDQCENKRCTQWRNWFLKQWDFIHSYPRRMRQNAAWEETGVLVGGRHYDAPHMVKKYLEEDPCDSCKCDDRLCETPCAMRKVWGRQKGESYGLEERSS